MEPKIRRQYTADYKDQAVSLVESLGVAGAAILVRTGSDFKWAATVNFFGAALQLLSVFLSAAIRSSCRAA